MISFQFVNTVFEEQRKNQYIAYSHKDDFGEVR